MAIVFVCSEAFALNLCAVKSFAPIKDKIKFYNLFPGHTLNDKYLRPLRPVASVDDAVLTATLANQCT